MNKILNIYKNHPLVKIVDARHLMSKNYKKFYYDELHLNEDGNFKIAKLLFCSIKNNSDQIISKRNCDV